ncbi:2OG-Fe dioxygenase family protein [Endozoicomonas acroporae]|uniref:2OG-Fe dioxygenase family protein n=1 Tax=Endozoicomonas acroporae TaxID=1701104 RepID=UPI003D7BFF07
MHQDGMDYIVSAFVVERQSIDGGESIIYSSDKKTPILKTVLQPGMGILQPDLGSGLWHTVTPISVAESFDIGWRSSIGLDFTVEEYD